jgi:hypothetical protein
LHRSMLDSAIGTDIFSSEDETQNASGNSAINRLVPYSRLDPLRGRMSWGKMLAIQKIITSSVFLTFPEINFRKSWGPKCSSSVLAAIQWDYTHFLKRFSFIVYCQCTLFLSSAYPHD